MRFFTNALNRVPLPAWASLDHPLVQREMEILPAFLGADGNLNVKMLLMAVVGMGLVSCSCSCGGFLWPVLMGALNLLPLLWGAMLVNREQATNRWDMLRATPYTTREILLAKLSAALYRLSPLLALMLAGQLMSYFATSWMLNMVSYSAVATVNGSTFTTGGLPPGAGSGFLALWGVFLVRLMVTTLLGFVLNLVVGLLASTLTESRGWAYAGAIGLRVIVLVLILGANVLLAGALAGGFESGMGLLAFQEFGQSSVWFGLMPSVGQVKWLIYAALGLLVQVGVLVGVFRLAEWRAAL